MAEDQGIRNFRDFLTIFNKMSEMCFQHCVEDLGQRGLSDEEASCVDKCVTKNIRLNHKLMEVYMKIQPEIMEKRIQDQEALAAATGATVISQAPS